MSEHKSQFGQGTGGAALPVKVVPRASKNEIVGVGTDGALKIRVTAPPVEGAANEAVIELLADALGLPKSNFDIVAGLTNTNKLVSIIGMSPAQVDEKLRQKAAKPAKAKKPAKAAKAKPKAKAKTAKKKKK
ncbi:MAG: DUF167 domain-containing protein [Chloroflexi bacterium]|nr:DUF167 domain-containing protein [Chloroflexota bacterium]